MMGLVRSFSLRSSVRASAFSLRHSDLHKRRKNYSLLSAMNTETIFALSSGPIAKSGVAVVRISGPGAYYVLEELTTYKDGVTNTAKFIPPKPRLASLRYLYSPSTQDILDQSLVLWFPGPRSFTGEDVVELHLHGSRAVIKGVFEALEYLDDPDIENNSKITTVEGLRRSFSIRAAGPGEFTRRAFENGKMDLTEVEGLSDLLDAETSEQRKQALKQMDGFMRKQYETWRDVLMGCLAHTEAVIDFGDDDREDDVDDSALTALEPRVQQLRSELEVHLRDGRKGELVREGIQIALTGPPNAGKSSLMNALARRPAAIVSPIAGTTRDIVEVRLELAGVPCIVSDTAGLRSNSSDIIELEGMKRARDAFGRAQIKVFVVDASDDESQAASRGLLESLLASKLNPSTDASTDSGTNSGNRRIDAEGDADADVDDGALPESCKNGITSDVIIVNNKIDKLQISGSADANDLQISSISSISGSSMRVGNYPAVSVYDLSCSTGQGFPELEVALTSMIEGMLGNSEGDASASASANQGMAKALSSSSTMITRERHRRHVRKCAGHLDRFLLGTLPMDASAEELRLAMMELGKITGRVDVEELLDIIFRDFCIGK
eukprot:CAMPEP_0174960572 /NCGR_PEP_ID=MMETSP0004_2-20121128/3773_1 /TAXON_ID=420556 /ORGANISM="Ochromonas sp., Strain CCMP1393" /LENGTH=609 /DNA_ID=CAMNT_0016208949 /DNA_START=60 /DNA_END=1889 /DNA_ORIENTATION=-